MATLVVNVPAPRAKKSAGVGRHKSRTSSGLKRDGVNHEDPSQRESGHPVMTLSQRIAAINLANTYGELRDAMDGAWEEAIAGHPEIEGCAPLQNSLDNGMYDHALAALAHLAGTSGATYPDLHDVLAAASRRTAHISGSSTSDAGH
ncbi:hypothetical protein [Paraburkholderia bannensis]|uniref:hypothetical protein n=1 Tax=Paraburkholderia bannensis TaxID=765414 RepID=UPI0012EC3EDB|nr:hypothetical protein [Paraburkholderia bannensis]